MKQRSAWQYVRGKANTLYTRGKSLAQTLDLGLRVASQFLPLVQAVNAPLHDDLKRGYESYEHIRDKMVAPIHRSAKLEYDEAKQKYPNLNLP